VARGLTFGLKQLDRGPGIVISFTTERWFLSAWTPDGRSVTFTSDETNGAASFWTSRADGSAPPVLQFRSKETGLQHSLVTRRKWLVYRDRGDPPTRVIFSECDPVSTHRPCLSWQAGIGKLLPLFAGWTLAGIHRG